MNAKLIIKIYFLVLFLEIIGEIVLDFFQMPYLVFIFKPLLMPLLIYWYKKEDSEPLKIMIYALVFSFFGDVFLMFLPISEHFFLAGLGSFLITHLIYLYIFVKHISNQVKSIFWRRPHFVLPFVLYGLSLLAYLAREGNANFAEMKIPVIVYASVIMLMVLAAIGRFEKVNQKSFSWVLVGALLFMFSDTLIALNNFTSFFDGNKYVAKIFIMSLYAGGQYLIVKGFIEQKNNTDVTD